MIEEVISIVTTDVYIQFEGVANRGHSHTDPLFKLLGILNIETKMETIL